MSTSGSFLQSLLDLLNRLFNPGPTPAPTPPTPPPTPGPAPAPGDLPVTTVSPRVLMIVYNPVVDSSGKRLIETMGWNDPDQLAAGYIADLQEISGGLVNYQVVQRIVADEIPVKQDHFQYTPQDFVKLQRANSGFHDPDAVDYPAIVAKFNLAQRIANNEFDEVWMFGGPYFGFWESTMGGAGAFFCNAPVISGTETCPRRFVIMGFNYQRGVGEMLEDIGHRAESIMRQVWRNTSGDANLFERYGRYDQVAPGQANVGLLHFAPNSVRDYDWGNPTPVKSCCDDWFQFPNLLNPPNYRTVTAQDWGNGDIRLHHQWWFKHLPHVAGATNGVANNWWKYVIDPNQVK